MAGKREAKLHAICVPLPAQGHVTPMLQLAKLLNSKGFHITFVNSEYNHRRLLRSRGPTSLDGTPSFRFETFPDGLPPSDADVTQDVPSLLGSLAQNCLDPFVSLLRKLNDPSLDSPPITLLISDCVIPFALDAARVLGDLPLVYFWPASACSFLGYAQFSTLLDKGIVPFKDPSFMIDGSLDKFVDWIPSMKDVPLKGLPSFIRTMDKNDLIYNFVIGMVEWCRGSPIIINTFDPLEHDVLEDISAMISAPIYTIGPVHSQINNIIEGNEDEISTLRSNLWKEDSQCLKWLNSKKPNSVVYVSFGSVTTMTNEHLVEFAWGLANSNHPFLWVIRPDLVDGGSAIIPPEFLKMVQHRGLLVSWCDQAKVLSHPSTGVFLTHNGWNSTIECITSGVPAICWPFFADQHTNCWYACNKWGVGVEVNSDVKRDEVEKQVRDVMEGEKGKNIKRNTMEWKKLAEEATSPNGSSSLDFDVFINYALSLARK